MVGPTGHGTAAAPARLPALIGLGAAVLAAVVAAGLFTRSGAAAVAATREFLEYYSGVFSLVALSITVIGGVVATDRVVLLIRHRILLQVVHRATAMASVAFLLIHIALKVAEAHATALDAVVPFMAARRTGYIGLGTIASYLMIILAWTGIIRGRFAGGVRPWVWRCLHATAYAAWPLALLHGLRSGRPAAGWVVASYAICLILVGLLVLVRLFQSVGRRLAAPVPGATTATIPVVRPAPVHAARSTGRVVTGMASPPPASRSVPRQFPRAQTDPEQARTVPQRGRTIPPPARSVPQRSRTTPPPARSVPQRARQDPSSLEWYVAFLAGNIVDAADPAVAAHDARASHRAGHQAAHAAAGAGTPRTAGRPRRARPDEVPDEEFWALIRSGAV